MSAASSRQAELTAAPSAVLLRDHAQQERPDAITRGSDRVTPALPTPQHGPATAGDTHEVTESPM